MSGPVERWLETFMCKQYAKLFEAYGFKTLHSVCQLQPSTLHSMGIAPEHCDKILENVSVLRQSLVGSVGSNYSDHGYDHQMGSHGQNNGNYSYHSSTGYPSHHSYGNPNGQMNHNMQYSSGEMYQSGQTHYGTSRPDVYGQSMYNNNHIHPNHTTWEEPMRIYNHSPRHVIGSSPSPAPSNTMMRSPPPPVPSPTVMGMPQHYSRHGIMDHPPPQAAHHHSWPQTSVMSPGMVSSPRGTPSPGMGHAVVPNCSPVHGKPFSPPPYSPHPPPAHQQTVGYDYPPPPNRNLSPSQALPTAQQSTQNRHLGSPPMNHSSDPLQSLQKMVMLEPQGMRGVGTRSVAADGSPPEMLGGNKTGAKLCSGDQLSGCGTPSPCSSYGSLKSKSTDSMSPPASETCSKSSVVATSPVAVPVGHTTDLDGAAPVTVPSESTTVPSCPQSNGEACSQQKTDLHDNGLTESSPETKLSSEEKCEISALCDNGEPKVFSDSSVADVHKKVIGKREQISENGRVERQDFLEDVANKPPNVVNNNFDANVVSNGSRCDNVCAKVEGSDDPCSNSSSLDSSKNEKTEIVSSGVVVVTSERKTSNRKRKSRRHIQRIITSTTSCDVKPGAALKKRIVDGDSSVVNGEKCGSWNVEISPEMKLVAKKVEYGKIEDVNCCQPSLLKVSSTLPDNQTSSVGKKESKASVCNSNEYRSLRRSERLHSVSTDVQETTPPTKLKCLSSDDGLTSCVNQLVENNTFQDVTLKKMCSDEELSPKRTERLNVRVGVNLEMIVPTDDATSQESLPVVGVSPNRKSKSNSLPGRKRGRPIGSKNKPRPPGSEKDPKKSSKKHRSSSDMSTVVASVSGPELVSRKSISDGSRPKGPYLHLNGTKDRPLGVTVVNLTSKDEESDFKSSRWKRFFSDDQTAPKRKMLSVGFRSTMSANYDVFTRDKTWICALCHKGSHHKGLGDLFGPYFDETTCSAQPENEANSGKKIEAKAVELQVTGRKVREKRKRSELVEEFFKSTMAKKGKRAKESVKKSHLPTTVELGDKAHSEGVPLSGDDSSTVTSTSSKELWIHEDCIVWAHGVYLIGHKIVDLKEAVASASEVICTKCSEKGATIGCHQKGCQERYHYLCAVEKGCSMVEETFMVLCARHKKKS